MGCLKCHFPRRRRESFLARPWFSNSFFSHLFFSRKFSKTRVWTFDDPRIKLLFVSNPFTDELFYTLRFASFHSKKVCPLLTLRKITELFIDLVILYSLMFHKYIPPVEVLRQWVWLQYQNICCLVFSFKLSLERHLLILPLFHYSKWKLHWSLSLII